MPIGMNANYGNFDPSRYVREDNTISRVGNRFADAVANLPNALRQGEQWQDERDARARAQETRMGEEEQKAYLYNQMQALGVELGGGQDALQIRAPAKGESLKDYALYTGSVFDGIIRDNPGAYDKIMGAAIRVGQGGNQYLPDAKAEGLLMGGGAGANGQSMGMGAPTPMTAAADGGGLPMSGGQPMTSFQMRDADGNIRSGYRPMTKIEKEAFEKYGKPPRPKNAEGSAIKFSTGGGKGAQGVGGIMTPGVMQSAQGQQPAAEINRFDPESTQNLGWNSQNATDNFRESSAYVSPQTAADNYSQLEQTITGGQVQGGIPPMTPPTSQAQMPPNVPAPLPFPMAGSGNPSSGSQSAVPEATRLRGLAAEIDGDIFTLRAEHDRLQRGGSGNSARAKEIRQRLDDKIKTRIALEEKIFNAERPEKPEKADPLLEEKRKLLKAQEEKARRLPTSKGGSGSGERQEFNTALSNFNQNKTKLQSARAQQKQLLSDIAAKENNGINVDDLKIQLDTVTQGVKDMEGEVNAALKFVYENDVTDKFRNSYQSELNGMLDDYSKTIANNIIDTRERLKTTGPLTEAQKNNIKHQVDKAAERLGLRDEDKKTLVMAVYKRQNDIINGRRY